MTIFKCDWCGETTDGDGYAFLDADDSTTASMATGQWLRVQRVHEADKHFCSHFCLHHWRQHAAYQPKKEASRA